MQEIRGKPEAAVPTNNIISVKVNLEITNQIKGVEGICLSFSEIFFSCAGSGIYLRVFI